MTLMATRRLKVLPQASVDVAESSTKYVLVAKQLAASHVGLGLQDDNNYVSGYSGAAGGGFCPGCD